MHIEWEKIIPIVTSASAEGLLSPRLAQGEVKFTLAPHGMLLACLVLCEGLVSRQNKSPKSCRRRMPVREGYWYRPPRLALR
jgi:hypothetical protein